MANCSNCSAPLPPNSIQCDYCGSRNDIDLKGINYYTTHEIESERICPRCNIRLRTIDLKIGGKFLIERCDECLGLFFDPGELEALLEATVSNVFTINRSSLDNLNTTMRPNDYGVSYIKCPICSKLMNRINFGTKSGVIVDRCTDHGVWLDGGELRHLFEWMKAGGKLLQQERQEQIKKEEEVEQERQSRKPYSHLASDSVCSSFNIFGSTLRNEDPDLFEMVKKAANFFTK
ncbi:MAG: zf-TFIIB domain-containing protein [Deltaproteobacteria bacterium]|nr:zf-TFIIB domain-containing protein [Deltaproteobacteria bacterium]